MTTPTNQEQQWTAEPWPEDKDHDSAPDMTWEGNYQRARTCVNACAGMADPVADIARLRSDDNGQANAHLKASAPQLLEACEVALRAIEGQKAADDGFTVHDKAIAKIRTAIQSAKPT